MTPKTKRRLKWRSPHVTKCMKYSVSIEHGTGLWHALNEGCCIDITMTKRQAIAACEKHNREKGNQ